MTGNGPSPLAGYQIVVGSGRSLPRLSFIFRTATANVRLGAFPTVVAVGAEFELVVAGFPLGGAEFPLGGATTDGADAVGSAGGALASSAFEEHEVSAP